MGVSGAGRRRPLDLLLRAVRFLGRTLRGEWQGIVVDPLRQLRRRGPSGLLLAFVAAFGVIFFHDLAQRPTGALVVWRLGGVTADLPLWLALLRTPVSLYVPALDLPVWAGITQLFLAFALAELALGRARTLAVAYAATLAGTLSVRVMIAIGPGWWGLGLPPEVGQVLDTGPSAAVVGLFTYLSVVRRAPVVFALTGGSMVWESITVPNLAGREHLIAVAGAMVLGLLHGHRPHWLDLRFSPRPHWLGSRFSLRPWRLGLRVPGRTRASVTSSPAPASSPSPSPVPPPRPDSKAATAPAPPSDADTPPSDADTPTPDADAPPATSPARPPRPALRLLAPTSAPIPVSAPIRVPVPAPAASPGSPEYLKSPKSPEPPESRDSRKLQEHSGSLESPENPGYPDSMGEGRCGPVLH
ncbi:hypothetical protein [Streptomyces sp. NPDC006012]|uniref:hypothetical protein n=1 Tax=Streptomyces sp. NPDC006012 TaxID=3364739 RepID=UPI003693BAB7